MAMTVSGSGSTLIEQCSDVVEVTVAAFRATGVGPWYHPETTSLMEVDVRVKCTQRNMRGPARKKF